MELHFGDVRKKKIVTGNHFVSHMIEHIAWRMGLSLQLSFEGGDWQRLGEEFGREIAKLPQLRSEAASLGMIDDGSAVVAVQCGGVGVHLESRAGVDLSWFLALRCEQMASGQPLVELLQGLSIGLGARISVDIWTVEDAHHTWEGIYRALGITLGRMYTPTVLKEQTAAELSADSGIVRAAPTEGIQVLERGVQFARVSRETAETKITAAVDFSSCRPPRLTIAVDESIKAAVADAERIIGAFSENLAASIEVNFIATELSSSHVVMEDIGLVLGRALLEILKLRMEKYGVNGAGSSIQSVDELRNKNVRAGISVEGRKFWRLVPRDGDFAAMKKKFILGQNVGSGLRSEDLDDFLDGFSGGMSASIMIHLDDYTKPHESWQQVFAELGIALREAFEVNPYRRGVPPGVKATLS